VNKARKKAGFSYNGSEEYPKGSNGVKEVIYGL
jgi:hypothetical protein